MADDMAEFRKKNFAVLIEPDGRHDEHVLKVTNNGFQWWCLGLKTHEIPLLIKALQEYEPEPKP